MANVPVSVTLGAAGPFSLGEICPLIRLMPLSPVFWGGEGILLLGLQCSSLVPILAIRKPFLRSVGFPARFAAPAGGGSVPGGQVPLQCAAAGQSCLCPARGGEILIPLKSMDKLPLTWTGPGFPPCCFNIPQRYLQQRSLREGAPTGEWGHRGGQGVFPCLWGSPAPPPQTAPGYCGAKHYRLGFQMGSGSPRLLWSLPA